MVLCAQANERNGTINLGERLFFETRFAQFFFARSGGEANFQLTSGDPIMATSLSVNGPLPGPFAGQSMNCRACHLVQELAAVENRTYADFAPRSPVPLNGDGRTQTPRNALSLVDALLPRTTPLFLHYDGQFASAQDLIVSTLTGRNFGWKPSEYSTALSHIAHIIRADNGKGVLAQRYGGLSYAQVFAASKEIPAQYQVLPSYRLADVTVTNPANSNYVTDALIVQSLAAVLQAYLENLTFSRDTNGLFNGSPYDVFLLKNHLPRGPAPNETPLQYGQRLLGLIENLPNPQFVTDPADGHFVTHTQSFVFGSTELAGMKIFFKQGAGPSSASIGNCVACHPPPAFTDFLFHNTGAAQEEYDAIHGPGTFMNLSIPDLGQRQTNYNACLPPTPQHPDASGNFSSAPTLDNPAQTDLGLWNVFANPDFPAPQAGLAQVLPQLIPAPAPLIAEVSVAGNIFTFKGTNGTPGWTFFVLASTNPEVSGGNWVPVVTNVFDDLGGFSFTNSLSESPRRFFRLAAGSPSPSLALPRMIALFKTPNLRDLAGSEPYLHTGRMNTLENVVSFYQNFSQQARAAAVRNPDPQLSGIFLDNSAVPLVAAFLRALNEDYRDAPCPCSATSQVRSPSQLQWAK